MNQPELSFVAAAQILVYVGAVNVLILFAIMLVNKKENLAAIPGLLLRRLLSGGVCAGLFVLLLVEGLRGRPLPERFQMAFMQSGFVFLVGLSLVLIVKDTSQLPAVQQLLGR
jgi:NADH:ubiquinone oxidoreductase subunit 6 (subunit J)